MRASLRALPALLTIVRRRAVKYPADDPGPLTETAARVRRTRGRAARMTNDHNTE